MNKQTSGQNRPLGAFEKGFLLLEYLGSKDFALAAEIEGIATGDEWRQALDALQKRHPNLSVAVRNDEYSRPCFIHMENSPIPLRIVETDNEYRWEQEIEKELSIRFDIKSAPLIRAVVIQRADSSILVMIINHMIGDGRSVRFLLRDTLHLLSGKSLPTLPASASMDEILGFDEEEKTETDHAESLFVQTETQSQSKAQAVDSAVQVATILLSDSLTQLIINTARSQGTTVHATISAALVKASREIHEGWAQNGMSIIHPVDEREPLKLRDELTLAIATHSVNYASVAELSFWDLARYTKRQLVGVTGEAFVNGYIAFCRQITFGGQPVDQMLGSLNAAFTEEVMFTNLGNYEGDTDFGRFKLKALYGPLLVYLDGDTQTVSANTVNSRLSLTCTSKRPLHALLDTVVRKLEEASNEALIVMN